MGTGAERAIFLRARTPRAVAFVVAGCLIAIALATWARTVPATPLLSAELLLPTALAALVAGRAAGFVVMATSLAGWLTIALRGSPGAWAPAFAVALHACVSLAVVVLTSELREALDREGLERRQLAELNREMNQLLGIAAHDLRSPLAVIALYTGYLLEEEHCRAPRGRQCLEVIAAKSQFMLQLVGDVLDLSRIEAGHLELRRAPGDWGRFVGDCALLLGELGAHRGVAVRVRVDETLPTVSFDANRMEQVVTNLVTNGLKFSPDGSLLEVTVTRVAEGVTTRVIDRGPGIPEEERARLFEPFRIGRVQPAAQRGTGLGLAIVRRIVAAHGGTVGVESVVGAGSTFWFTLPAEGSAERCDPPREPQEKAQAAGPPALGRT